MSLSHRKSQCHVETACCNSYMEVFGIKGECWLLHCVLVLLCWSLSSTLSSTQWAGKDTVKLNCHFCSAASKEQNQLNLVSVG